MTKELVRMTMVVEVVAMMIMMTMMVLTLMVMMMDGTTCVDERYRLRVRPFSAKSCRDSEQFSGPTKEVTEE